MVARRVQEVEEEVSNGNLQKGALPRAVAQTILNGDKASLKRLAWAYGCAKKDSDEERQLRELLLAKARHPAPPCGTCGGAESTCNCPCGDHYCGCPCHRAPT